LNHKSEITSPIPLPVEGVATEEIGEVAREIYENGDNLYHEVIQCAAVYMAWAEALRRSEVQPDEEHC